MHIDTGMAAVLVTILITLVGMGIAWGTIREKVKHNTQDIEANNRNNREDHQQIFTKLDEIKSAIKSNGLKGKV